MKKKRFSHDAAHLMLTRVFSGSKPILGPPVKIINRLFGSEKARINLMLNSGVGKCQTKCFSAYVHNNLTLISDIHLHFSRKVNK